MAKPHNQRWESIFITAADGGGDDTISGGTGDDFILGQQGNDFIVGGSGQDDLTGGWQVDMLMRAEENLYFVSMMKLIGHKNIEHIVIEGADHGRCGKERHGRRV